MSEKRYTLRLTDEETGYVERLKAYTYSATASGAIMTAVRNYQRSEERAAGLEKELADVSQKLIKYREAGKRLNEALRFLGK
jgi:hypothetical protein